MGTISGSTSGGAADHNAQLMLMIAHIIRSNKAWENAEIRLLRLLENEKGCSQAKAYMASFLKKVRVCATPVVLVNNQGANSFADTLSRCNTDTDLLLLGLPGTTGRTNPHPGIQY